MPFARRTAMIVPRKHFQWCFKRNFNFLAAHQLIGFILSANYIDYQPLWIFELNCLKMNRVGMIAACTACAAPILGFLYWDILIEHQSTVNHFFHLKSFELYSFKNDQMIDLSWADIGFWWEEYGLTSFFDIFPYF